MQEWLSELRVLVDAIYDDIAVADCDGVVLWVNEAFTRLYDLPASAVIGRRIQDLEAAGIFSPSVTMQVLRTGRPGTLVQETQNGRRLVVTGYPVRDGSGRVVRVVSAARDISELSRLKDRLHETESLLEYYRQQVVDQVKPPVSGSGDLVYVSAKMEAVSSLVQRVAPVDSTVLVLGESGTGKELIARALHGWSARRAGPFVKVNCAAIPESLVESELFGYARGAFTGARKEGKPGLVELANGGTLFLDEIGELPLSMQAKFLQVLQERVITPVGGTKGRPVDFRLVAATNRNLQELVSRSMFREDLYYRLNVVRVVMPPLRERPEDIPLLAEHFLTKFGLRYGRVKRLSPEVLDLLMTHKWPGNVRELENYMESLVVTVPGGVIEAGDLSEPMSSIAPVQGRVMVLGPLKWEQAHAALQRQLLYQAASRCKSTYEMADWLGISQSSVVRLRKQHNV